MACTLHTLPQEQFLIIQLHELLGFLSNHGEASILVLAQQGIRGFDIAGEGIQVGATLVHFQGMFTGTPVICKKSEEHS